MDLNSQRFNAVEKADSGLQAFFNKIYGYMATSLGLSALVAYLVTKEPFVQLFYTVTAKGVGFSLLGYIAVFSPLILIFMIGSAVNNRNVVRSKLLFWGFSALMGVSLSQVFLLYTSASIFQAFLVTGGSFLALSLYGRATNKDLTGWGTFLYMGLFGLIITIVINLFMKSTFLTLAVSLISLVIFAGLVVYDTNRLKSFYYSTVSDEDRESVAVHGALSLYLNFINLFWSIINFLGERK